MSSFSAIINLCLLVNFWVVIKPDSIYEKTGKHYDDAVTKYTWGHNLSYVEDIVFPGLDQEKLNKIELRWKAHYECLTLHASTLNTSGVTRADVYMVYEGETVLLPCQMCIAPHSHNRIKWKYTKNATHGKPELLHYTSSMILYSNGYLQIYDVTFEMEGLYLCAHESTDGVPVLLEVVDDDEEPYESVRPKTDPDGKHASPNVTLSEHELIMYTKWSPWSICSSCTTVGIRYKIGICFVDLQEKSKPKEAMSEFQKHVNKFLNGLPCRSIYLKQYRNISATDNQKNEIMTALCEGNCPNNSEVVTPHGNTLSLLQHHIGKYGRLHDVPPCAPVPGRVFVMAEPGVDLKIRCPGHLLSEITTRWKMGKPTDILRENVFIESRVNITARQQLIIKNVQISDSNIYSCWKLEELAGSVKLVVKESSEYHFHWGVSSLMALLIVLAFLLCLVRICKMHFRLRRLQKKQPKKDKATSKTENKNK